MAVLLEMSIFSISGGMSKSDEIAKVLRVLQESGYEPHLNPMGTTIQTQTMPQALKAIEIASECMDTQRYYLIAKFDCHKGKDEMLEGRVERVLQKV